MKAVSQAIKHLLVGAVATIFDLVLFTLLVVVVNSVTGKAISFLCSTIIKYWGNKYWAFSKHDKEDMRKEIAYFFFITIIGLFLDVGFFYYFTKMLGPQFGLSPAIWIKLSVIFAALSAAVWNFLGYKLLVFKK